MKYDGFYRDSKENKEQRTFLLECQGGVCAICGTTQDDVDGNERAWNLDHDHETGKIRGVLCPFCNVACAGLDNPDFREKVWAYLNNPPAKAIYRELSAQTDPWLIKDVKTEKCVGCGLKIPQHLHTKGSVICQQCEYLIDSGGEQGRLWYRITQQI